jgi:hypothetical protein
MNEDNAIEKNEIHLSKDLLSGIISIIESSRQKTAIILNTETSLMYWSIGNHINQNLKDKNRTDYGNKIVATLSQQLTEHYGRGFTYTGLTRMCKVAELFNKEKISTLSQQLSWSHFIEISTIKESLKREFYLQMSFRNSQNERFEFIEYFFHQVHVNTC